jgi:hypothetical protein
MTFFTENAYAEVTRVCEELGIKGEPGSLLWETNLRNAIRVPPLRIWSTPTEQGSPELKEKFEAEFVKPERYFLIGFAIEGRKGHVHLKQGHFPTEYELLREVRKLEPNIQSSGFIITLVHEFKSEEDYESANKGTPHE